MVQGVPTTDELTKTLFVKVAPSEIVRLLVTVIFPAKEKVCRKFKNCHSEFECYIMEFKIKY